MGNETDAIALMRIRHHDASACARLLKDITFGVRGDCFLSSADDS